MELSAVRVHFLSDASKRTVAAVVPAWGANVIHLSHEPEGGPGVFPYADFFAINPMAFWKRAESIRHGFDSVRLTIEQNYDELSEVFSQYGLELNRDTAREKAERLMKSRGWTLTSNEDDGESEAAGLRLVKKSA